MASLADIWSALREPLRNRTFQQIKELAAAAGFSMEELGHLTQAKVGSRAGASKHHLIDALDRQYGEMLNAQREQAVRYIIEELAAKASDSDRDRMEQLLRRRGWELLDTGVVVPLELASEVIEALDSPDATAGLSKALERYGQGDLSGAVAAAVGAVETAAGVDPGDADYTQRIIEALRPQTDLIVADFAELDADAKRITGAFRKSTNQTVELLASFRRNYSDVHGEPSGHASQRVLRLVFHSAAFILNRLAAAAPPPPPPPSSAESTSS